MRAKTWCLVAILAFAALAGLPTAGAAADEAQPAVLGMDVVEVVVEQVLDVELESAEPALDFTPTEGSEAEPALLIGTPERTPVAPKCKGCPPNYQGFPRVTCDPCCYVNDIGVRICLS